MREFLSLLWHHRTRLVATWAVVMVVALVRLLTMADVYTSSALLTPLPLEQVEESSQSGIGGGTVRSLLGKGSSRDEFAVVAFMQSRQLLSRVVDELDLTKKLFPGRWDEQSKKWRGSRGGEPTDGQARRALDSKVDVSYDEFTGLMVLEVNWEDADVAYRVASAFVSVSDRMLREAAVEEGERRVAELERELSVATVGDIDVYLAEELTRVISSLASIRAKANYGFRVIDPPTLPDRRSWPPRFLLLVIVGIVTASIEVGVLAGVYLRLGSSHGDSA